MAELLAELRTDVRPTLWAICVLLIAAAATALLGGVGLLPMNAALAAAALCVIFAAVLAAQGLGARAVVYRITAQRIEIERGYLGKRYESIDLFRVKDVVLEQGLVDRLRGVGRLTVYSTDHVEPVLSIGPVQGARPVFEKLRESVSEARRAAGASVLQ